MKVDIVITSSVNPNVDIEYLKIIDSENQYFISPYCLETKVSDEQKVQSLATAITDDSDIILAVRGGSGAPRLMPLIKDIPLAEKEKILIGYSDLTVLLNYLHKDPKISMLHGPMARDLHSKNQIDKYLKALKGENVTFDQPAKWLVEKPIIGEVIGGNLMVLGNMIGTFYQPDFTDKVLLIEEISEDIEIIDRYLTKLRDSGSLDKLRGVIIGSFCKCPFKLEDILPTLEYYFKPLNIGVLYDVNLTHNDNSDYIYLHKLLEIDENGIYYK